MTHHDQPDDHHDDEHGSDDHRDDAKASDADKARDDKAREDEGAHAVSEAEAIIDGAFASEDPAVTEGEGLSELEQSEARSAERLADLQRLQAEFVNYRKRADRDRAAVSDIATAKVIESLIPVLDDLTAAREHGDLTDGPFAAIADKLEESLGRLGWSRYGAAGDEFDPQLHEALMSQTSADVETPTVSQVAQPGHRIGDKVVRPARVVVAQPE